MELSIREAKLDGSTAILHVSQLLDSLLKLMSSDIFNRMIASDDEYTLFSVVVFKRVHDEFIQKCRVNKYAPFVFRHGSPFMIS